MDNPDIKEIQVKRCTRCGLEKPLRKFDKCSGNPDGLQTYCKKCSNKSYKIRERNKRRKIRKKTRAEILYDMMKKRHLKTIDGSCKQFLRNFSKESGMPIEKASMMLNKIMYSKDGQKYFEDNGYVTKTITYTRTYKSIKIKDQKK